MHISVIDPFYQTSLFVAFLLALTALKAKKDPGPHEMNHSHTDELKGVAILMVVFSHIGYFLFSNHKFLYPLSVAGGVGVNIFLFLSGFGLTSSELNSKKPIITFYLKRLKNIFIPMWLVLTPVILIDYKLGRSYSTDVIAKSILGFFPNSDIDSAINSPLWYFTLILFYYLVFPLVFRRRKPVLSISLVFLIGFFITSLKLPVTTDVLKLYKLHYLAFPLGMTYAYLNKQKIAIRVNEKVVRLLNNSLASTSLRYLLIALLAVLFGYTAINSGVGETVMTEQLLSLVTVGALFAIFLIKDIQSNFLITLGKYSYEIYLVQWPLMYRYDFIYKHTPAFLGTLLYIAVFLVIGFVLNRTVKIILKSV